LDTSLAWRREGPERTEKFFIQSLLSLGLLVGRGGLVAMVLIDVSSRSGGVQEGVN